MDGGKKEEEDFKTTVNNEIPMDLGILPKKNEENVEEQVEMKDIISEAKENISDKASEADERKITQEIIDIINKEKYKRYKGENNNLNKLKIKGNENFSENKILIEIADLLQVKQIKFDSIETNIFNSLLSENSLMIKNFQKILSEKEKRNEKEENEIEPEIFLEKIFFKNCEIDINFGKFFPLIKKFVLKNCKVSYDIAPKINFNFLTHLILENIGLIDYNLQTLFYQIRSNKILKNSLKIISLKNNNIGMVDPCKGLESCEILDKLGFKNLEVFDLSNNKIFFISNSIINPLINLKLIDLTNNALVFPSKYKSFLQKEILVLLTKNYALLNDKNKEEYINYLLDIIPKVDYGLISISLVNLYIGRFYEKMKTLNLSKYSDTLIELDISYGNIKDNDLQVLLKGNLALHNLKHLNLSKNKLTEKFLDILVENDFEKQFSKLKILDVSGNLLGFTKAINYQNFFEKFKSLKLFIVKHTPFELSINNYIRTLINRYYELRRKNKIETEFTPENKEIHKIVDDGYLVKKTNVTISLIDTGNNKYVSQIKTQYPKILERINFETRFYGNK